jgi:hypothetical protein
VKSDSEAITILVLESGASWPSWGTGLRLRAPNAVVEAQLDGESVASFEERVVERLARLRDHGERVLAAGYACGLSDGSRTEGRKEISRVLLGLLEAGRVGADSLAVGTPPVEFIVAGGPWGFEGAEGAERERVLELWADLSTCALGQQVSARFEETPYDSGVFRVGRLGGALDEATGS